MSDHSSDERVGRMQFLLGLRQRGIVDADVLRAMDEVPREHFIEAAHADDAYADHALPIACGQTISQPYVVAYMTEKLDVKPHHRVLEIGTGSGYQAAVLSRLADRVVSVERYRRLAEPARHRLQVLGYGNVEVVLGDGMLGHAAGAPYDRIIVTAAAEAVPQPLIDQLGEGGVLVAPVGPQDGPQHLVRLRREDGRITRQELLPVRFVPLLPGQAREL